VSAPAKKQTLNGNIGMFIEYLGADGRQAQFRVEEVAMMKPKKGDSKRQQLWTAAIIDPAGTIMSHEGSRSFLCATSTDRTKAIADLNAICGKLLRMVGH
jgi:hypothetical protein